VEEEIEGKVPIMRGTFGPLEIKKIPEIEYRFEFLIPKEIWRKLSAKEQDELIEEVRDKSNILIDKLLEII
jgi:bifunctional DNA-binding transcriptional regulator/antitoxin component of YhaV-PrlF toxin-antitoxin module